MRVYNYMLSKFSHNTQEENEVVMTMLHHVAVDIKRLEVLYQIPILTTFASLWEAGGRHITKVTLWLCQITFLSTSLSRTISDRPHQIRDSTGIQIVIRVHGGESS